MKNHEPLGGDSTKNLTISNLKLKWQRELLFNLRYAVAGVFNGLVGLTTIWVLTKLGALPVVSNFLGFVIPLSIGFLNARRFVFRSEGRLSTEAIRYLVSFSFCYLINLTVLYLCIAWASIEILLSQGIAVCSYVISMYLSSRLFVFGEQHDRS